LRSLTLDQRKGERGGEAITGTYGIDTLHDWRDRFGNHASVLRNNCCSSTARFCCKLA
jgi:hypothetical protein